MRRILIVGGGPAGTLAAIAAKRHDPSAAVTLLSCESCEPYEKPPLSKAVLLGQAAPGAALIAGPQGVAGHDVVLECAARCTAIDRAAHTVLLEDGRRLPYHALVIATGSTPREIACLPVGMPRVHYLRSEADARALQTALAGCRNLLVVGGGLIGLEVAASAAMLGVAVTVLEMAPRILARVCDEATGDSIHAAHRDHGVDVHVATTVEAVTTEPDDRIVITCSRGERFAADLVVVGTGSTPDDALAAAAGLATEDGILVDRHCRTSDPSIFAAGDCARFPGPHGWVRLENWIHAQEQGAIAGRNAAGASEPYVAVPSFWSEQYDLYIQGVGWAVAGATRVRRSLAANRALMLEISDGCLISAMGINAQRDIAVARRLIERRVPVDAASLADKAQPLAALLKRGTARFDSA